MESFGSKVNFSYEYLLSFGLLATVESGDNVWSCYPPYRVLTSVCGCQPYKGPTRCCIVQLDGNSASLGQELTPGLSMSTTRKPLGALGFDPQLDIMFTSVIVELR